MKKIYLIGKDINYSKSPFLQNSILKKLGYDNVEYEIKNFEIDELEIFIEEIRNNDDILGANVTIPYKKIIGEKYTELREPVNIIYKDCGRLMFSSTDFISSYEAISDKISDLSNFKIFILGNGGVAESIQKRFTKIASSANDVTVFARNTTLSTHKQYKFDKLPIHKFLAKTSPILYINCTPVKEESLVPKECLKEQDIVFDMNYSVETKLMKDAKEVGCQIIYGIDMLIYNSIFSLQMFLDEELNVEELRDFLKNTLNKEAGNWYP